MTPPLEHTHPDSRSSARNAAQSVVIAGFGGADQAKAAAVLVSKAFPEVEVDVAGNLEEAVKAHSAGKRLLVVWTSLENALVATGRAGEAMQPAMQFWTRHAITALQGLRKHRRALVMLESQSIQYDGPACADVLAKWLGRRAITSELKTLPYPEVDDRDALLRLRARGLVHEVSSTRAAVDELLAMTALPPRSVSFAALLDRVRARFAQEKETTAAAEARRAEVEGELVDAQHTIERQENELERLSEVEADLARAKDTIERQQNDMVSLEEALLKGREDNAERVRLLTHALQDLQAALEDEKSGAEISALRLSMAERTISDLKTGRNHREEILAAAALKLGRDIDDLSAELADVWQASEAALEAQADPEGDADG